VSPARPLGGLVRLHDGAHERVNMFAMAKVMQIVLDGTSISASGFRRMTVAIYVTLGGPAFGNTS